MLRMSFDLQPVLKGELLGLRPLRPEDFHDLYAVASDPLIWEQHPIKDRYKEEVFKGFFREALESGGALIAIDSKDGQVIGSSRLQRSSTLSRNNRAAEYESSEPSPVGNGVWSGGPRPLLSTPLKAYP